MTETFPAAALWRRLLCMIYEGVILFALVFVVGLLLPMAVMPLLSKTQLDFANANVWVWQLVWGGVLVSVGAYLLWSWLRGGQTLAMRAWRLRLTAASGGPLLPAQALVRLVLCGIGFGAPLLAFAWARHDPAGRVYVWASLSFLFAMLAWALIDEDRQFLHDRLAGTRIARVPPKQ